MEPSKQSHTETARRVRWQSPHSGETDSSDATRNDKQRRVIGGNINDSSGVAGVQIEGERHQLEPEAEPRLRCFACGVGDCRRRYKNIDRLRTSLTPLSSCYLTLSSCSFSLSAFGRPWRNWTRVARVRAAQMVAAFRSDRGDSTVDRCAKRYNASDTSFADQVPRVTVTAAGLWPVSALAL